MPCACHDAAGVSENPLTAHQFTALPLFSFLHSQESTTSVKLEVMFTNVREQVIRAGTLPVHRDSPVLIGTAQLSFFYSTQPGNVGAAGCAFWLLVEGFYLTLCRQAIITYKLSMWKDGMTSGSHNSQWEIWRVPQRSPICTAGKRLEQENDQGTCCSAHGLRWKVRV